MVNTILTALGMWALQIPGVGLLSLFVFICGFIPIVSRCWLAAVYALTSERGRMRSGSACGVLWTRMCTST